MNDQPPANVDLSAPDAVAVAYLEAIQRADPRAARGLAVGSPEQKQWIDARVTMVDGMRKFDNALYAKFGRIMLQAHVDMHDSLLVIADGPLACIREGTVSASGNEARIDPKPMGFWSRGQTPIYLLRDKEGWRVDLAKSYGEGRSPAAVSEDFQQERTVGEAFAAVAAEVLAGRYGSADQASAAVAERLRAAFVG